MNLIKKLNYIYLEKKICSNGKYPQALCQYINYNKNAKFDPDPARNRYVVIDTETTGLDYKNDIVISFGGIRIDNLEINISDSYEVILYSDKAGNSESISVHGIRNADVKMGVDRNEFFQNLLYFFQGDIIIGHHVEFDKLILSQNLSKIYPVRILNPVIDTFDLAIYLEKDVKIEEINFEHFDGVEYTLDRLIQRYNIRASGRHTAIGDAFITAELFLKLITKLKKKKKFNILDFMK